MVLRSRNISCDKDLAPGCFNIPELNSQAIDLRTEASQDQTVRSSFVNQTPRMKTREK